jgi:hypothetical protein
MQLLESTQGAVRMDKVDKANTPARNNRQVNNKEIFAGDIICRILFAGDIITEILAS